MSACGYPQKTSEKKMNLLNFLSDAQPYKLRIKANVWKIFVISAELQKINAKFFIFIFPASAKSA